MSIRPVGLFYVYAGAGHKAAAVALREVFDERHVSNVLTDILVFSNRFFKWVYSSGYDIISEHAHLALKGVFRLTDQSRGDSNVVQFIDYMSMLNVEGFVQYMRDNPSMTAICTHFFPANVLSNLKKNGVYKGKLYVVVTDYGFHKMWCNEGVEKYFVASSVVEKGLLSLGVENERILKTGIPIEQKFLTEVTKKNIWKNLCLPQSRFTLLFVMSAIPDIHVTRILEKLFRSNMEMNLILIAGRNKDLLGKLEHFNSSEKISLKKYGFVDNMNDFLSVAHLILTKPGGLTISEALVKKVPILMFDPIPYQETENANYIEQQRAGILAKTEEEVADIVEELYDQPFRLEDMRGRAGTISYPHAASYIVDYILGEGI
ncbi:MGDG synthase family glycosyltransferase [Aminobacterium mobile]|jgi:processive 1,2-diacylglycerol beta-glucosyltransferase|uniref:MGDG synthase family glycosyltransferase n=2 Tax=Aminobacterium TaxID=81466 RepID=UPI0004678202|nr:glycosyltransferase [Aminobacterium mobile]